MFVKFNNIIAIFIFKKILTQKSTLFINKQI